MAQSKAMKNKSWKIFTEHFSHVEPYAMELNFTESFEHAEPPSYSLNFTESFDS